MRIISLNNLSAKSRWRSFHLHKCRTDQCKSKKPALHISVTSSSSRKVHSIIYKKTFTSPLYQIRFCHQNANRLSHVDAEGNPKMIDVSEKPNTDRIAIAGATVDVGPQIAQLINKNNIKKGNVLGIAQIAGIMGAKRTSELIPLCHNIFLSSVKVDISLDLAKNTVNIIANVHSSGKTGVEMEALTAVSIAALTVYDMCKAVSHDIVIKDIRLFEKSGGKKHFKYKI